VSQLSKHNGKTNEIVYTVSQLPAEERLVVEAQLRDFLDTIICGDCRDVLPLLPPKCVDLIVTSPPYADRRDRTYGGIKPDEYVDWFLPIAAELKRVLKPTGSFILNIKEPAVNGERHTFVIELILKLREQGWFWVEEYIWHKKNCYPGKWPNRFRDAWERCLHFTVSKKFAMYQEAVMVPMGDWRHARLRKLSETDKRRDNSKVGSGFGKNVSNWVGRDMAYPTNVLHLATECGNRGHSATFPVELPKWFIKLFTQPNDVILDPFIGSGTTAVACREVNRHFIGIDSNPEFCALARERVRGISQPTLWEARVEYTTNQSR
jgi:DNA modification methylase